MPNLERFFITSSRLFKAVFYHADNLLIGSRVKHWIFVPGKMLTQDSAPHPDCPQVQADRVFSIDCFGIAIYRIWHLVPQPLLPFTNPARRQPV